MGLRLSGIGPRCAFARRLDAYVPLDIDLTQCVSPEDELFYWRSTDSKHLLEIKIAAKTGILGGVSVVLVPQEWIRVDNLLRRDLDAEVREGVPIFDLSPWRSRIGDRESWDSALGRIDESVPFLFLIGTDRITVQFGEAQPALVIRNGDLEFIFTQQGEVCGVALAGVLPAEIHLLRKYSGAG